jgi:hypothetical protein
MSLTVHFPDPDEESSKVLESMLHESSQIFSKQDSTPERLELPIELTSSMIRLQIFLCLSAASPRVAEMGAKKRWAPPGTLNGEADKNEYSHRFLHTQPTHQLSMFSSCQD